MKPSDEAPRYIPTSVPIHTDTSILLQYLSDHPIRVIIALTLLVLSKLATVGVALIFKEVVDNVASSPVTQLAFILIGGYGALRLTASLCAEGRDLVFSHVVENVVHHVGLRLFHHLHTLSADFHSKRNVGSLTRDLDRGIIAIKFLLTFVAFHALPTVTEVFLVLGIFIARYDIVFVLTALTTIAAYVVFTLVANNRQMRLHTQYIEQDSKASGMMLDSLLSWETIKFFVSQHLVGRKYKGILSKRWKSALENQTAVSALRLGQATVLAIGLTIILLLVIGEIAEGRLTVGDLVLVTALLLQLYGSLDVLGFSYYEVSNSLSDFQRVLDVLNQTPEIIRRQGVQLIGTSRHVIRFDKVHFGYTRDRPVLCDVTLDIPAGSTVGVVGPSGSGKSTLVKLLFRFYDPTNGQIFFNGETLRNITLTSLRHGISVVPQEPVLFNGSIYDNILCSAPESAVATVVAAAREAGLHAFVETMPAGYGTIVGERGLRLSGGEKQRVAIARALLKKAGLLILDEATSFLDAKNESVIWENLKRGAENRTTLIIAHQLSSVVHSDQIFVMDQGKIVQSGTHSELLAQTGLYADMWTLQRNIDMSAWHETSDERYAIDAATR